MHFFRFENLECVFLKTIWRDHLLIDSHVHVFPNLGDANGYESVKEHMDFASSLMFHRSIGRRLQDNALIGGHDWYEGAIPTDVDFRGGKFGRFLWSVDGVDYARYYLPPTARELDSPPEQVIAQMDYVGVDRGVISGGHTYGRLNDYIGDVISKYPKRFYGLASICEWKADDPNELYKLRHAIVERGLHGLFFDTASVHRSGRKESFDADIFEEFWDGVRDMDIPIFWNITSVSSGNRGWIEEHKAFGKWLKKYPDVLSIYTHGIPLYRFWDNGKLTIPSDIWDALEAENVYTEILVPILMGGLWDYPYVEAMPLIKEYYNRLGAQKLVWGSDMPNVERHCTYTQSLDYMRKYCTFISKSDFDLICGENMLSLL